MKCFRNKFLAFTLILGINASSVFNVIRTPKAQAEMPPEAEKLILTSTSLNEKQDNYYTEKYNLNEDEIARISKKTGGLAFFNQLCEAVEQNLNIPSVYIPGLSRAFSYLIEDIEQFNQDRLTTYLHLLSSFEYIENFSAGADKQGEIVFDSNTRSAKIIIYEEESILAALIHDVKHAAGVRYKAFRPYGELYYNTTSNSYCLDQSDSKTYDPAKESIFIIDLYGNISKKYNPSFSPWNRIEIYGFPFEEGEAYEHMDNKPAKLMCIYDLYKDHIFGRGKIKEFFYSENKIAVLMNTVLDCGFTRQEVEDFFRRLDSFYKSLTAGDNPAASVPQLLLDAEEIFEKLSGSSYEDDAEFCAAVERIETIFGLAQPIDSEPAIEALSATEEETTPALTPDFYEADIPEYWMECARILYEDGVVTGYADGSLRYSQNPTRAEFITMLYKLLQDDKENAPLPGGSYFADMQGHWANPYVEAAYNLGITEGVGNGKFAPDLAISADIACTMLARALNIPVADGEKGLKTLHDQGIVDDITYNYIVLNDSFPRGCAFALLHNAHEYWLKHN